jgi:hypothetical protein
MVYHIKKEAEPTEKLYTNGLDTMVECCGSEKL